MRTGLPCYTSRLVRSSNAAFRLIKYMIVQGTLNTASVTTMSAAASALDPPRAAAAPAQLPASRAVPRWNCSRLSAHVQPSPAAPPAVSHCGRQGHSADAGTCPGSDTPGQHTVSTQGISTLIRLMAMLPASVHSCWALAISCHLPHTMQTRPH